MKILIKLIEITKNNIEIYNYKNSLYFYFILKKIIFNINENNQNSLENETNSNNNNTKDFINIKNILNSNSIFSDKQIKKISYLFILTVIQNINNIENIIQIEKLFNSQEIDFSNSNGNENIHLSKYSSQKQTM